MHDGNEPGVAVFVITSGDDFGTGVVVAGAITGSATNKI